MSDRPFTYATVDVLDVMGEKSNIQLQHVHIKDYGSSDAHCGKAVMGDGEMSFFGTLTFNEMDKEMYLSQRYVDVVNNILHPGMYRRK